MRHAPSLPGNDDGPFATIPQARTTRSAARRAALRVVRACGIVAKGPSSFPGKLGACRMPMAGHQMVIDHADGLHEGVDDGRAAELEPTARQILGDFLR